MDEASKQALIKIYTEETDLSVDQLPYTRDFERVYKKFSASYPRSITKAKVWQTLANLRKRGFVQKPKLAA